MSVNPCVPTCTEQQGLGGSTTQNQRIDIEEQYLEGECDELLPKPPLFLHYYTDDEVFEQDEDHYEKDTWR
jgi:hypothetical protein